MKSQTKIDEGEYILLLLSERASDSDRTYQT